MCFVLFLSGLFLLAAYAATIEKEHALHRAQVSIAQSKLTIEERRELQILTIKKVFFGIISLALAFYAGTWF